VPVKEIGPIVIARQSLVLAVKVPETVPVTPVGLAGAPPVTVHPSSLPLTLTVTAVAIPEKTNAGLNDVVPLIVLQLTVAFDTSILGGAAQVRSGASASAVRTP
jgi:hypothetical protein